MSASASRQKRAKLFILRGVLIDPLDAWSVTSAPILRRLMVMHHRQENPVVHGGPRRRSIVSSFPASRSSFVIARGNPPPEKYSKSPDPSVRLRFAAWPSLSAVGISQIRASGQVERGRPRQFISTAAVSGWLAQRFRLSRDGASSMQPWLPRTCSDSQLRARDRRRPR